MKLTKDLTKSIVKKEKYSSGTCINFFISFSFLFLLVFSVSSQIVSPFNIRYQVNQKGGIKILSNVSVSCGSTANNCTTAQGEIPPSGNYQNGSFTMSYVDIDGDATTFSSSKDSLTLPNCSEILWAGLYWGGRIAANTTNYATRNQIKVKVGNGIYQPFTADQTLDVPTINGANWSHPSYFCFKNITPLVVSSGLNARFTVADLVTRTGTSNMWGGWSIVVVYKNVLQTMRNLTVFDGFANVSTGNSLDIPISGFTTPLSGPVNFELGVIACDGDRDSQGDQLQFNGAGTFVNISDALHQTNNFFNSTISDNAVLTPFRLPNYSNTLGYDAGIFYPNNTGLNYIGNNANSAIIRVSTSSENILARAFTSAIDIFEPDLRATVYVQDLNGGTVNPGDVLEYRVVGKNIGSDVSLNTFMTDTLDIRTNFVPGSIQYMNGPFIGAKTDGFGDDQAEYDPINRVVITRVNIGANALNGGTMNNSPNGADSAVIKFQVVVVNDCLILSCDSTINNKAYIFGTGNISSNFYTNNGTSDIYDANGCPTNNNNELTINTVACPDISIAHNQVCIGDTLQLSMINSLYANYFWTGPNGFSSNLANPTINNVVAANAGVYFLNITFNGSTCTYYNIVDTVVIDPNPIITLVNLTNISCFNANNGSISVSASSTPPYSYLWSNSSTSAIINNLSPGNYTVTVNDNLTCHSTATYTITQPNLLVANAVVTSNYNGQQISCFNASDGTATVNVIGGTQPYSYLWSNGQSSAIATGLNIGTTTVTVTDANGCIATSLVNLTQPIPIAMSSIPTNVLCFGGFSGSIDLTTSGGTFPYTYTWSNGATVSDVMGLTAGTYNVLVTDINGCTNTLTTIVTQPPIPITPSQTHINVGCYGDATGSIDLSVIGGTPGYTYSWSTGSTTQDIANLPFGIYTVFVTDINACVTQFSVTINQPTAPLTNSAVVTPVGCFGQSSGAINMGVSGGTPPYTYSWSNGATIDDISAIPAGIYNVTVLDFNNCLLQGSYTITQPDSALITSETHQDISCFGAATGSIDVSVIGGTQPFSYFWNNGFVSQDLTNLAGGNYSLTIQDANGCQDTINITLIQLSLPIFLSETHTDVLCNGFSTGSIDLSVSGGLPGYNYFWSNGLFTQDINSLTAGIYSVIVTDINLCTDTLLVTIAQPLVPLIITETHINPSCIGGVSGSINLSVTGGVPGYTYQWNNGETTQDIDTLASGIFVVQVSDSNGCQIPFTVPLADPSNGMAISAIVNNISCYGGADGSIDLSMTGGNPGYYYAWSNGVVVQDQSNLPPGSYYVTVTDVLGCGLFLSTPITQPDSALNVVMTVNSVACFNDSTGSVVLNVSGGTPAYNYTWSNGATTQSIYNLPAGTYSGTVTDSNGCTVFVNAIITQPPSAITLASFPTNVICFGTPTGAIDLSVSGGMPNYTYSWNNGATTQDLSNVVAGNYSVTVQDSVGCTEVLLATITQPIAGVTLQQVTTHVSCFGGNDGSINLSVSAGTAPYTYLWSNGATTQDLYNLTTGIYSVAVLDANNCSISLNVQVNQPATLVSSQIQLNNVTCNNGATGDATATALGGTPPYTFIWSNGQSTAYIDSLIAGIYALTVSDNNGCTAAQSIFISQPLPIVVQSANTNNICYGQAIGTVSVSVIGGTAPYLYLWNNGSTNDSIGNLPAGPYFVTITDDNGCTVTISDTVTQPASPIAISALIVDNICFGYATGTIDLTALGGTAPYQYQWNNGTFTQDLTTLLAGTYNVVVMDNNGCLITDSFTVNQPPAAITINSTAIQVACFGGNNASINLTLTGPAAPFDFIWSNGATTEDLFNLSQGAYTVQVSDTNNCTTNATINITQPAAPVSLQTITTNVLCFGNNSGAIDLSVFGGTLPYSYVWSNNTGNQDLNNILAGNYNVSVTDANGCSASIAATITQPLAPITTSLVQTNILCFGQATGAIDVSVAGGTPNYTYAWSNNTNAQDITAVNSGFYALVITDANGCTANVSATLTQPTLPVNVAASVTNVSCFNGNNGAIVITITGGVPSYSFLWSNGETTQNIDTLTNANYALQLTDFNGCYSQWNISVNQPNLPLLLSVIPTDPLCFGGSNGSMDLFVVGGTAPYSYLWNNGATSQDIINLNAGIYSVVVTDINGCTQNIVDTLQQPASFVASTIINNINCYAQNTGSIDLSVSGGTAPYTYLWNNTATTQDITGLLAGIYNVIITDNNGCSITDSSILSQPLIPTILSVAITNASCFSASDGAINLTVVSGNSSFSYLWNNQAVTQDLNNLPSGNYSVIVTDNLGCINTISAIVAQPNNLVISSIITNPLCSATATGDIDISITGGTAPYSYAWLTGQNTQDISNLSQGIYFLTVTDANGCSQQATFQLTDPSVLIATATFIQPTCPGGNNGSINATITGATAPYSFLWSTGAITEDIFNVSAGNDTLFTTDNNGCIDTLVVSVTQPSPLLTNFITTNIVCFGTQTGAINLSVIGGTAPYTYLWSNGLTTQDLSNLNIGQYIVQVTDANGCITFATATITQPSNPLSIQVSGTNVSCFGGTDGSVNLTVFGGVAPYQINWSNAATTEDIFNLQNGTYSVQVQDANGCIVTGSITISQPNAPLAISNAILTNVSCFGLSNGIIDITVVGGSFPYFYSWSNNAITQDLNNITSGGYSVTVTDFNGCSVAANYTITQPSSAAVISYLSQPVFCFGDSTGWINATVIGGALPYSFAWSNGVNAEDIFNIPSGTYTLTVTDNVNCITTAIVNITQPAAPLFANAIIDNVSCFGLNDASIVVNITGGSPSYILSWSTGDNGNTIDTLAIGNYQLNITDSLACQLDTTFTITQPATLTISAVITNVACFGDSSAIINVTPLGGTAPFYYTWSNGASTQDLQNIPIGSYSLAIIDTNGCTDSTQFNITQPLAPISISSTQVNVGCFGNNSGAIDLSVAGGTPGYTYLWSNTATTQDLIALVAGNYSVIVTDNLLCQETFTVTITQPQAPLVIIPTITNAPCFGQAGGSIGINVIGGTQPYSYYWNTTDTTQSLVGIPAGQYSLAVTDSNNCVSSMLFNITQPQTSLAIVVTQVPVSCFGYANGQMNVIAAGGISPYNYLWSNGQNTATIDSLTAGLYTVTVTDDNGCQVTQNQVLTQPDSLVADFNSNAIFGCIPFEAELTNNSLGNYASATWTIGNGDQLFNLDTAYYQFNYPGCYDITLTLTSPNGCMATSTQYSAICVVSGPIANFYSNPQEIDFYTGDIQFINTSAGANNNYFWYFGDGTQGQSFSPFHNYPAQTVGTYEVMLVAIDSNGCVDTTLQVYQMNEIIVMNVPNAFTIDDNNLNDSFKPIFSAPESIVTYDFSIFNRWGQLIYQTNDPMDAWDGKYLGKFVQTGAYNWTVSYTDINKQTRFANGHVVVLK